MIREYVIEIYMLIFCTLALGALLFDIIAQTKYEIKTRRTMSGGALSVGQE